MPLLLYSLPRLYRASATTALMVLGLLLAASAHAGISYQLDTAHALGGETITVKAVLFNDTDDAISWTPPQTLALQWRGQQNAALSTEARLAESPKAIELPINNFVTLAWHVTVPTGARGMQTITIEDEPGMLALDTSTANNNSNALADGTANSSANTGNGGTAFERFRNAISTFEPIYFDVGTRNGPDARFQISFKYRLHTPADPQNTGFFDHWYLGYTQTSLWDLSGHSKPFIDTTYNPSLFWQKDRLLEAGNGRYFAGLAAGVEHKSNGKSGADSRSLNSFFVQPQLNYRFNNGSTLSFNPRIKNYFAKNENPDYAHYMGYVDWKLRWAQDNGLVLDALYNQGRHGRYRAQLQAAWPLRRTFLNMNGYLHVQYFRGYGETLLGYREKTPGTWRIGLSLVP